MGGHSGGIDLAFVFLLHSSVQHSTWKEVGTQDTMEFPSFLPSFGIGWWVSTEDQGLCWVLRIGTRKFSLPFYPFPSHAHLSPIVPHWDPNTGRDFGSPIS